MRIRNSLSLPPVFREFLRYVISFFVDKSEAGQLILTIVDRFCDVFLWVSKKYRTFAAC